jgi:hypothetical protein
VPSGWQSWSLHGFSAAFSPLQVNDHPLLKCVKRSFQSEDMLMSTRRLLQKQLPRAWVPQTRRRKPMSKHASKLCFFLRTATCNQQDMKICAQHA